MSPRTDDGRIRCDPERPELWSERPCDKLGMNRGFRCYACGGLSQKNDADIFVQAFNASCDEITLFEGKNVDPMDLEDCLRARTRDECPSNDGAVDRLGL